MRLQLIELERHAEANDEYPYSYIERHWDDMYLVITLLIACWLGLICSHPGRALEHPN